MTASITTTPGHARACAAAARGWAAELRAEGDHDRAAALEADATAWERHAAELEGAA